MRGFVRFVACRLAGACERPLARENPARESLVRQCIVAFGFALALGLPASAQTDVLNELYGSGVHAYNSGDMRAAYAEFTMAIRSGSRDPRVYYYRGLAYLRLGRPQEAQADFQKGAALEMSDTDRFYPVSRSLERIQGSSRAQIERHRSRARLVAYQTRERRRYERYDRIRKNEPNVLMTPDEAAEIPAPAARPAPAPAEDADAEMPEKEMPAEKPEADEADPFADEAAEKKKPAEAMPEEEAPEEEMPGEKKPAEKPAADDADPFAEDSGDAEMPAAKKPAGDEEPADEKPADDEKPAGEKKPSDDDPFSN